MKSLKDTVLEAISSRRNHKEFPKDNTDKQGIIDWLEYNGFEFTGKGQNINPDLVDYKNTTGKDCYALGNYDHSDRMFWWIKILYKEKIYFIRTIPEDEVRRGYMSFTICEHPEIITGNTGLREATYKEIVDELNK